MFSACVGRRHCSGSATRNASSSSAVGHLSGVGVSKSKQKQIDDNISKRMRAAKKEYNHTYRLLLLGSGESGKSTIVKQMQILHKEGFTSEERLKKLEDIRKNVLDSIVSITRAMSRLDPPITMLDSIQKLVQPIWVSAESLAAFEYTDEFYDSVKTIWADEAVKQCYLRANEYQLIDCAQYFLDKVDEIRKSDYSPSDQDILRCRSQTTGIHQVKFIVEKVHFHLFDVGGQRYERRRWCQCFHGITAILFVTAMSDFNLSLAEDQSENRLKESIKLFGEVWRNRFLQNVSVILFLNKQDLLASKMIGTSSTGAGSARLEDVFPEFVEYRGSLTEQQQTQRFQATGRNPDPSTSTTTSLMGGAGCNASGGGTRRGSFMPDEPIEVSAAKRFIRDLFVKEKNERTSSNVMSSGYSVVGATNSNIIRQFYAHYTCAVDTENIRRIFNDVKNTIQIINLKNYELI